MQHQPQMVSTGVPSGSGSRADATPAARRFLMIHRRMRERIALHRYPPGQALDLDALAGEFAVSRTPVRRVVQRLADEGLVVSRHGVPTIVSVLDRASLADALAFRARLAPLIGELSPRRPTAPVRGAADAALEHARSLGDERDIDGFVLADMQLHDTTAGVIGNEPLLRAYDQAYYRSVRLWWLLLPALDWTAEVRALVAGAERQHGAIHTDDARALAAAAGQAATRLLGHLER